MGKGPASHPPAPRRWRTRQDRGPIQALCSRPCRQALVRPAAAECGASSEHPAVPLGYASRLPPRPRASLARLSARPQEGQQQQRLRSENRAGAACLHWPSDFRAVPRSKRRPRRAATAWSRRARPFGCERMSRGGRCIFGRNGRPVSTPKCSKNSRLRGHESVTPGQCPHDQVGETISVEWIEHSVWQCMLLQQFAHVRSIGHQTWRADADCFEEGQRAYDALQEGRVNGQRCAAIERRMHIAREIGHRENVQIEACIRHRLRQIGPTGVAPQRCGHQDLAIHKALAN